jgi:hypothetical protein
LDATENVVIIFRLQSCGTVPNQAKLDEWFTLNATQ